MKLKMLSCQKPIHLISSKKDRIALSWDARMKEVQNRNPSTFWICPKEAPSNPSQISFITVIKNKIDFYLNLVCGAKIKTTFIN